MAFDAYLKIDGIPGECTDLMHPDWIEILSFNYDVSQVQSSSLGGGHTAERATLSDFAIVKYLDRASPKLFQYCCEGKHCPQAVIELCHYGKQKEKFMEFLLRDVVITTVQPSGSTQNKEGGTWPTERITLDYGKIRVVYHAQPTPGSTTRGRVEAEWDLKINKAV